MIREALHLNKTASSMPICEFVLVDLMAFIKTSNKSLGSRIIDTSQ